MALLGSRWLYQSSENHITLWNLQDPIAERHSFSFRGMSSTDLPEIIDFRFSVAEDKLQVTVPIPAEVRMCHQVVKISILDRTVDFETKWARIGIPSRGQSVLCLFPLLRSETSYYTGAHTKFVGFAADTEGRSELPTRMFPMPHPFYLDTVSGSFVVAIDCDPVHGSYLHFSFI